METTNRTALVSHDLARLLSWRGIYVSMIEQCQKIRRIRSDRGDDSSFGLLNVVSLHNISQDQQYWHLVISAWHANEALVAILQRSWALLATSTGVKMQGWRTIV